MLLQVVATVRLLDKNLTESVVAGHGKSGLLTIPYPELTLYNMIEQEHRKSQRIVKPMLGFTFNTARKTLRGIAVMKMIQKG